MFFLIGLGLFDEQDITLRGLNAIKSCSQVFLEHYTSILLVDKDRLESLYGKSISLADRDLVETQPETFLEPARNGNVALLIVGDPLGATTHTSLLLSAREMGVEYEIIHNASIMNAISSTGLSLYNFGQTVSLVFFTENWKPDSFYDRIAENARLGLHTLVLLDIKVKEQSEENLARGRKIFEPPRFMSIPIAISQLLDVESTRASLASAHANSALGDDDDPVTPPPTSGVLEPSRTLAITVSRLGSASQKFHSGTLSDLQKVSEENPETFGQPLHSVVIIGKRLHDLEVKYMEAFAVDRANWRRVAQEKYGVKFDE